MHVEKPKWRMYRTPSLRHFPVAVFETVTVFTLLLIDNGTWPFMSFQWKVNQRFLLFDYGVGIAQCLERRTRDWKVTGSNPCRSCGRIFFSRVNFLCWLLFRYPFHPRITAVARKRSRSFCQKCRWQVTAKHAYTLCMWLCMKWHGCMVYTELAPRRLQFRVAPAMPAL